MDNKEIMIKQLLSMNALANTLLEMIDTSLMILTNSAPNDNEKPACSHPVNKRKDYSTMGSTCWQCMECGHIEGTSKLLE